jgi:hypothetical protein
MERIIGDIEQGTPGNSRFCFTMDNLDSHTNGAVQALIFNAGTGLYFVLHIILWMVQLNIFSMWFNVHFASG